MFSGSFKSSVDSKELSLVPGYFHDENILFRKYVESRFNKESVNLLNQYKNKFISFKDVQKPSVINKAFLNDWHDFISLNREKHSEFDYYLSEHYGRDMYPRNQREFIDRIKKEVNGDINEFNRKYNTSIDYWNALSFTQKNINNQSYSGNTNKLLRRFGKYAQRLPIWHRVYSSIDGNFIRRELLPISKGDLKLLNKRLNTNYKTWSEIVISKKIPDDKFRDLWINYVKNSLNSHNINLTNAGRKDFKSYLKEKYKTIGLLNKTYLTNYEDFGKVKIPEKIPVNGAFLADWKYFISKIAAPEHLIIRSVEFDFRKYLKLKYGSIEKINEYYKRGYTGFDEVDLSTSYKNDNLQYAKDWKEFVTTEADPKNITLNMAAKREFIEYLEKIFSSNNKDEFLVKINKSLKTSFTKIINVYPSKTIPKNKIYRDLWIDFVRNSASPRFLSVNQDWEGQRWINYLQAEYGDIEKLNESYHLEYNDFDEIEIDYLEIDYYLFKQNKRDIFWEFFTRNYEIVIDEMVSNGRALLNTIIYCALAIFIALFVNPLAAYSLSRFNLRSRYKVILLLMLTMAFPPMVLAIPNFLLLKNLNLFNTFWALILPGAADGYFIFLLKGFFDSLPKELYESATIDGASEFRIFSGITIPLSKPILAVIALNAFNAAYRNFMFAFLVCQDKSMWTMMVHMYQLMQRSTQGIGFAAVTVAAILPLIVFIFSQRFILKVIVVPSEK